MGGSAGTMVRRRRNATDELFAVFDVPVVVSRSFVFLHQLPTEKIAIKLAGASLVWCIEIAPAERAVGACDADAGVYLRLPNREGGSGGVLQDGHAACISNVKRRSENRAAEFGSARGRGVRALHGDVDTPVGRHAELALFGTNRTGCCCVPSLELVDGVKLVGADGNVVGGPTEYFAVEGFGGGLVGGDEFGPTEVAGSVFLDVWHGWRLRFGVVGSKG